MRPQPVHRRYSALCCEVGDPCSVEKKHPVWQYEKGTGTLPGQRRKCALELIRRAGAEWIELVGFESMATRGTLVTMSLSNSICVPASAGPAPCDVPIGAREAGDEPSPRWIAKARRDDRDRPSRPLGRKGVFASRQGRQPGDELGRLQGPGAARTVPLMNGARS